jgi:hypothetical protein
LPLWGRTKRYKRTFYLKMEHFQHKRLFSGRVNAIAGVRVPAVLVEHRDTGQLNANEFDAGVRIIKPGLYTCDDA